VFSSEENEILCKIYMESESSDENMVCFSDFSKVLVNLENRRGNYVA
jgi:hypothetical protein